MKRTPPPGAASLQAVLQQAEEEPWKHGFIPIMRALAAQNNMPPIGKAQRPQQESFRLGQTASLAFAPREIAKIEHQADPELTRIKLYGLGSLGPNGSLPIHVTELVRERVEAKRDDTLANFLDLFHHRALTHLYRAWAQSQSAAGLDRSEAETFTPYVARLTGDEPAELQDTQINPLSPHARWASAAHRVRAARNPEGLVGTLSRYFGVPVSLEEYCLQWMPLEPLDQTHLGTPQDSNFLGQGAIAGEVIPDRQNHFRLIVGPLSLDAYLRLTPEGSASGKDLPALIEIVRSFIGFEYVWELDLLIERSEAPPTHLGGDGQLGWSTWMGKDERTQAPIQGMRMQPEAYAAQ